MIALADLVNLRRVHRTVLADLVNLTHLDNNGFTGPIPPELASLTNLESLDLDHNLLSGPPAVARRVEQSDRSTKISSLARSLPGLRVWTTSRPGPQQRPVWPDPSRTRAVSPTSRSWISRSGPVRTRAAHQPQTLGSREQQPVWPDTAQARRSHQPGVPVARQQRPVRTDTCRTGRSSQPKDPAPARQSPGCRRPTISSSSSRTGGTFPSCELTPTGAAIGAGDRPSGDGEAHR